MSFPETAFQIDAFQSDAFQMTIPVGPKSGGAGGPRGARAKRQYNTETRIVKSMNPKYQPTQSEDDGDSGSRNIIVQGVKSTNVKPEKGKYPKLSPAKKKKIQKLKTEYTEYKELIDRSVLPDIPLLYRRKPARFASNEIVLNENIIDFPAIIDHPEIEKALTLQIQKIRQEEEFLLLLILSEI
jgi:hypothetical protein